MYVVDATQGPPNVHFTCKVRTFSKGGLFHREDILVGVIDLMGDV